jgi:hypothetical protein
VTPAATVEVVVLPALVPPMLQQTLLEVTLAMGELLGTGQMCYAVENIEKVLLH